VTILVLLQTLSVRRAFDSSSGDFIWCLFLPNAIDEPRLRLARLLPRRRRDGRGRWLWRLVSLFFHGRFSPPGRR
jgi:hypothetical protein